MAGNLEKHVQKLENARYEELEDFASIYEPLSKASSKFKLSFTRFAFQFAF